MLSHLVRQSRSLLIAAGMGSVIAGICSVLLVAQINAALTSDPTTDRVTLALRFAVIALAAMLSQMVASVLFERLGQRAHAELRRFISARVIGTPLRRLEEIGGARVQSALAEHSAHVAEFFTSLPTVLVNAIIVTGCLVYMAWLSWPVFIAAVLVTGLGSLGYMLAQRRAMQHLDIAAKEQDRLFGHFRSLIEGAKELRLHAAKRLKFSRDVLGSSIEAVRRERTFGVSVFLIAASWGNFLVYAFIGLVLFMLVGDGPDRARVMTGFALVFVYMVAPLENLLLALPRANLARASGARIDEITRELDARDAEAASAGPSTFSGLTLQGVTHSYFHEGANDIFTLGPVNLSFAPGQITFLVGGNGSGKTSLAKLFTGLYEPEQGAITFNGEAVDDQTRDRYRQLFSAIFSDFHLFEQLLDSSAAELDARGNRLIQKLQLQHKVRIENGAFTTQALSQGQRKRLALVVTYLEDRPIVVFDEWAADQDPVFKDVFYRELLPELKAMGKCVLVITHDDRYFSLADRLVRMESGQVQLVSCRESVAEMPAGSTDLRSGTGQSPDLVDGRVPA